MDFTVRPSAEPCHPHDTRAPSHFYRTGLGIRDHGRRLTIRTHREIGGDPRLPNFKIPRTLQIHYRICNLVLDCIVVKMLRVLMQGSDGLIEDLAERQRTSGRKLTGAVDRVEAADYLTHCVGFSLARRLNDKIGVEQYNGIFVWRLLNETRIGTDLD